MCFSQVVFTVVKPYSPTVLNQFSLDFGWQPSKRKLTCLISRWKGKTSAHTSLTLAKLFNELVSDGQLKETLEVISN